jgi:cyclophilin family peptidyl-prolyl cis-trans isomerase
LFQQQQLKCKVEVRELFEIEWADELEQYQLVLFYFNTLPTFIHIDVCLSLLQNYPLLLQHHNFEHPLLWDRVRSTSFPTLTEFREWITANLKVAVPSFESAELVQIAADRFKSKMSATGHEFAFVEFNVPHQGKHRVLIELYSHITPLTCANFRALCVGDHGVGKTTGAKLHYQGCPVHRIMPQGYFQTGGTLFFEIPLRFILFSSFAFHSDIVSGKGDQGDSIYGATFADETFAVQHNVRGIVGMASGLAHTNASQFYITLRALPYLDTRCVAFGRVVSGLNAMNVR